jgi:hypothetical protein
VGRVMGTSDVAPLIRACWLSWLAVATVDQAELVKSSIGRMWVAVAPPFE